MFLIFGVWLVMGVSFIMMLFFVVLLNGIVNEVRDDVFGIFWKWIEYLYSNWKFVMKIVSEESVNILLMYYYKF